MTKPQITSQISLGNIIQIALILAGLTGAWFTMGHRTEATAAGMAKNAADLVQIEVRVRALETRAAADTEQLRTLQRDISELKQGQRETNGLLRQLLQRGALE
jgi:uncharacterized coiled-coil protein SlyX